MNRPLNLSRETVRNFSAQSLERVVGGLVQYSERHCDYQTMSCETNTQTPTISG